ncbi:response regulator transcription factor [Psychroflexus planctonicus]|uniref:Response regulatory domain-containing protein n=1 Tax=Psychroflexus planctonicus TaxID=1526575 RepID=A0ABQ1SMR6_9FLAO|nr:response regulator [Psychroflexus planctonicus]GGE43695.1 hypothetical protein GCM10010832_24630 [Psychroflexus planctonicus]
MKKILIVDDEPNIVMALEYTLKKNDFQVFIARNGEEAIAIAQDKIPDVVVLDIMMPKVDGFEVLNFIKKHKDLNKTKVIFLSAKNKEKDIQKGLDQGADQYLTKPFSMKKLLQEIDKQISGK